MISNDFDIINRYGIDGWMLDIFPCVVYNSGLVFISLKIMKNRLHMANKQSKTVQNSFQSFNVKEKFPSYTLHILYRGFLLILLFCIIPYWTPSRKFFFNFW
jgi:hypothetical protein